MEQINPVSNNWPGGRSPVKEKGNYEISYDKLR